MQCTTSSAAALGISIVVFLAAASSSAAPPDPAGGLHAGVAVVDITPQKLPVIVNGGFLSRTADKVHDPLAARCIVLGNGPRRLAIVVVDSCMVDRDLCDKARRLAHEATGIAADHILISATHTHSAPSAMDACLGTPIDADYAAWLPGRIAESVKLAASNMQPAQVGSAVADAAAFTANRRWIRRAGKPLTDPFGEPTVRAMMHPGYNNPDYVGESGPVDPELSLLSVQTRDGKPLAVLANFSMHYFSAPAISADYFGLFAKKIGQRLGAGENFVGILSQGTSGDLWRADYGKPPVEQKIEPYTDALVEIAARACATIEHDSAAPLAVAVSELPLDRRVPDEKRIAWAQEIVGKMGDRLAANKPEVYAVQALWLRDNPRAVLWLQAMRVGDLGITAIPNEVYAITGLKLKAASPFDRTMNISLANGSFGYIPPPEQHALGGYNTWPASSAGLEVPAETKITEAMLALLEKAAEKPRRPITHEPGPLAKAILESEIRPVAYWRMNETGRGYTHDELGRHDARYLGDVAFYLDGPEGFAAPGRVNRAPHLAGGCVCSEIDLPASYTVELSFWNGLKPDLQPVTGWLLSRVSSGAPGAGDHLGLGGTQNDAVGRLIFTTGEALHVGTTKIAQRAWHRVRLVRDGQRVRIYLDGSPTPEIDAQAPLGQFTRDLFIGKRSGEHPTWQGRVDEVVVYDRALPPGK